jgi:hypothetical protein
MNTARTNGNDQGAAIAQGKPKRSHHKKKPPISDIRDQGAVKKPNLPPLDELAAAQEAARHAQEGNTKLARAIDALRECLQIIVIAEMDNHTKLPVTARDLRALAAEGLDAYSAITGQNWRLPKHQVVRSRAGDRNQATLGEEGYG